MGGWDATDRIAYRSARQRDRDERRLRRLAGAFAVVAVVAAAAAACFALAHADAASQATRWQGENEVSRAMLLVTSRHFRARIDLEKETSANLRRQLDAQTFAYAEDLRRLAGIDEQLQRAHVRSVAEILRHVEVHHADLRNLLAREGWLRRDRAAAQCYLSKECDPTRVDFGGEVR